MSRHIGRNERWKKSEDRLEEYVSDFGVVRKDKSNGSKTWMAFVKDGFSYRICGNGFLRARNAMIAAEEASQEIKDKGSPLPPIQFPARIF